MAKVPTLKSISKLASCHVLLDFVEETNTRLTKYLLSQLEAGVYSAITEDLLQCLLHFYAEKLTDSLLKAVVPCHLREFKVDKCLPNLSFFGLTEVMKRCPHLHRISLKECDQLMSPGQFVLWRRIGVSITALCLESCRNVSDQVVQSALRHIPTLQYLNVSSCESLTEKAFLLNEDLQKDIEFAPAHNKVPHYECSLISVDVSGCPGITATAVRHLTSLTGPTLQNVNLSWTSINLIAILSLAGYSLPALIELVISYYNRADAKKDPRNDELYQCLLEFKNTLEKVEQQEEEKGKITGEKAVTSGYKSHHLESNDLKVFNSQISVLSFEHTNMTNRPEVVDRLNENNKLTTKLKSIDLKSDASESGCSTENADHKHLDSRIQKSNSEIFANGLPNGACINQDISDDDANESEYSSSISYKADCVQLENVEINFLSNYENVAERTELMDLSDELQSHLKHEVYKGNVDMLDNEDIMCASKITVSDGAQCLYQNDSNKVLNNCICVTMDNTESDDGAACRNLLVEESFNSIALVKTELNTDNKTNNVVECNSHKKQHLEYKVDMQNVSHGAKLKADIEIPPCSQVGHLLSDQDGCTTIQKGHSGDNFDCNGANDAHFLNGQEIEQSYSKGDNPFTVEQQQKLEVSQERIVQTYTPKLISVDITNKFSSVYETVGFDCLKEFLRCSPNLQKFGMSWAGLRDEMVKDLTPFLKDLREINLNDCESVTCGITDIGQTCKNLEKVDFNGIHFIKDMYLRPFLLNSELQCLYLAETDITDGTLFRLAARKMDKFEELDLSWCDDVTVQGLDALCRKPSTLKKLSFRHCPANCMTLALMAENLKQLQCLNICSVDGITDSSVVYLVENLPLLKEIDISWNSGLSDVCVKALLRSCIHLQKAVLSGLKYLTSAPFLPIISDLQKFRRCQALLRFKLQERNILEETGDGHYSSDEEYEELCVPHRSTTYAPNLQVLELEYCDCVDDNHLAEIVAVCRGSLYIVDYFREAIKPVMIHAQKDKVYLPPQKKLV